jgi:MFS transporter, DHA1 family, multidrug resistance protein
MTESLYYDSKTGLKNNEAGERIDLAAENWKRNLYVMFVTEFIVMLGFSFVIPFMPLFVRELGDFSSAEASRWSGIAVGISGISLFISGPIWGIVSDRWGRKPMVLRALFGSAVVLLLSRFSPNIYVFVTLRFIQGFLSGTVPAASALVASSTPRDKTPYAMGLLMVGVFIGNTIGPTIGGVTAEFLGLRDAFYFASAMLFCGGLLVLILVKEKFERPPQIASLGSVWNLASSSSFLPLLITICCIGMAGQLIQPIVPLFMSELNPGGAVVTQTGLAFTLMGLIAAVSLIVVGQLSSRFSLRKILIFSCLGSAVMYLLPFTVQTATQLVVIAGIMGIFQGGLVTSTTSFISLSLPVSQQGVAYGMSQSATSLGSGLGPIIGGSLAPLTGLRYVFGVSVGLYLVACALAIKYIGNIRPKSPSDESIVNSTGS